MIADSNAFVPLEYVDPTYQASLFVRATIWDLSGGSPVIENTLNLSQLGTSAVYQGKYQFTAGKPYQVVTQVYTSGSYATVDTGFPQSTERVQCIDLKLVNLDATVSSRATQTSVNSIPTNPLLTTDGRLAALDATISSRLPTSSYVAPDNADIAAIKAQTDQLTFSIDGVNAHVANVVTNNIIQPITGTVLEVE